MNIQVPTPFQAVSDSYSPRLDIYKLVSQLDRLDPTLTIKSLRILLYIAVNQHRPGGVSPSDIRNFFNLEAPSANRFINYWGTGIMGRKISGHEMIYMDVDQHDRRRRRFFLTPKGERFVRSLEEDII